LPQLRTRAEHARGHIAAEHFAGWLLIGGALADAVLLQLARAHYRAGLDSKFDDVAGNNHVGHPDEAATRVIVADGNIVDALLRDPQLFSVALAVLAPGPATRAAHAVDEFFLAAKNAPFPRLRLLGVFDPTDELVSSEWRDVVPPVERGRVGEQRRAQVARQLVHHSPGYSGTAHGLRRYPPCVPHSNDISLLHAL
jgi:hypothetical protein